MSAPLTTTPTIRTPDQRLRVFVSSTIGELAEERLAARQAIDELRLVPVLFELGARPHPPRDLYRAYLAQSHVFVGIYWQSYGWTAPDMEVSGLEDEYRLAGDHPKLIYIKVPADDREPALTRLLDRIRDDDTASYRTFAAAGELRDLLENDLAVLLTERFEATAQDDGASRGADVDGGDEPLPSEPTSLIGRERDIEEMMRYVRAADSRLVTITGAGGSGKTRLAVRVAELVRDELGRRVCFVDLTGTRDAQFVLPTIATAVGVRDVAGRRLVDATTALLSEAPRMLVLDNFEHVIEAANDVADILMATGEVTILVTSRQPLRLRWEQEFPLRPLEVPPRHGEVEGDREVEAGRIAATAAVELFVERARRARSAFVLTDENAPVVAEICRRLDGLPLAIELAAARLRILSPAELLPRLEHRLDTLSGGAVDAPDRHRTLREAIGWSHDLLRPEEQEVFRRIAVFSGGCTLDAIEVVCGSPSMDSDDLLEILEGLVDKSLVVSTVDPTTMQMRFSLLETVREFGLEQLRTAGEEHEIRRRHLESFHRLVTTAAALMRGPEMGSWLDVLDREHDNIRSALDHAEKSDRAELGLEMAVGLRDFWDVRGHYREGIRRLRALLDATVDEPTVLRGRSKDAVGWLTGMTGDYELALAWLARGLRDTRATEDVEAIAWSTCEQGIVACNLARTDEAAPLLRESRELADRCGDRFLSAWSMFGFAEVALIDGDLDTAVRGFEEVLVIAREIGQPWSLAWALATSGAWHVAVGAHPRAIAELIECLRLRRELRDDRGTADTLGLMACLASSVGDHERSARLHGAAEIGQQANAVTIWPFFQPLHEQSVDRVRGALTPSRLDELWRRGRSTPMSEIVNESLDQLSWTEPTVG
jgi:predicted ATPase